MLTTDEQIKALAEMMNISEHDVRDFAQLVADQLKADEADQAFINADVNVQTDLIQAYSIAAAKKTEQFVTAYMTKGREALQAHVYHELKARA